MYEKEGEPGVETVHAGFAAFWTQGWRLISHAFLAAVKHSTVIKRYYPYRLSWQFLHRPLDFVRFRKQAARFACVDFASSAQWRCFRLECRTHEAIRGKP